jgi:hypothetical protein
MCLCSARKRVESSQGHIRMRHMTPQAASRAARQHALITTRQLQQTGMSRRQVRYAVRAGELVHLRRGVYRVAGTPPTWEQVVLAAVLAAGPGAVVSHATAAALWALKHGDRHRAGIHITAPRQLRLTGVTAHIRPLPPGTRTTYLGIPVTTPEQTIVDLAATMTATRLGECIDDADRRHLIKLGRMRQLVDAISTPGRRPVQSLRRLLADRLSGYEPGASEWEREMDRLWDELGLPPATRHYKVLAGGRRCEIDRAIPELQIGVEWNGYQYHGSRSAFDYDSDRRADLTAEGWHMIDFTSNSTPKRILHAVLRAVEHRTARLPLAGYDPGTDATEARRQRR